MHSNTTVLTEHLLQHDGIATVGPGTHRQHLKWRNAYRNTTEIPNIKCDTVQLINECQLIATVMKYN